MIDPRLVRPAHAPQLSFSERETDRLVNRIEEDYRNAIADHQKRMQRWTRYYMRWRSRTPAPVPGEEHLSNFQVPVTQWQTYAKLAKAMDALFGADAEVIAQPVGPSDQGNAHKVGRYQSWRVFNSMRLVNPATVFTFRQILFGRGVAYSPWMRETYLVPLTNGGVEEEVFYEGPGFNPLWPDDFIVPAEDGITSLQDFSFVIRKYRATPDDLLRGEGTIYRGVRERFEDILSYSENRKQRDYLGGDQIKGEKDLAEGVLYDGALSPSRSLIVHEWYGRWRKLRSGRDARVDSVKGRDLHESELVVRYIPELHMIVGIQDLAQMYPRLPKRRPFVEAALVQDGSYWSPGFGELLESIELELTANHNLASDAGALGVFPLIFYKPGMGFDPDTSEWGPRKAIPTDDPTSINAVSLKADLNYPVVKEQTVLGYAERVTGITDMSIGRSQDRPNAPKTARQTLALIEEGDVRASLDTRALRESWSEILQHFWLLDSMYAPERVFFRVTEQEARGLFDVVRGGAYMTAQERYEKYDFSLKFATNAWSRETRKQNQLALYQLDLGNPLIAQNPRALWVLLDKVHREFGDDNFGRIIPEPPDLGLPIAPSEELSRMLQGETVLPNPLDNDQLHVIEHNRALQEMAQDPEADKQAFLLLAEHVGKHIEQYRQKQFMQATASGLAQQMGAMAQASPMAQQQQGAPQQGGPMPGPQMMGGMGPQMMGPQQ